MDYLIKELSKRGYLISDDFVENLPDDFEVEEFIRLIEEKVQNQGVVVLNKDLLVSISKESNDIKINWGEFDRSRTMMEKGKDGESYKTFLNVLNYGGKKKEMEKLIHSLEEQENGVFIEEKEVSDSNVIILKSFKEDAKKRSVDDFVYYFRKRLESVSNILKSRQELTNVISLNRLNGKKDNENVAIIGIVIEKRMTKNDNVLIKMEDFTGDVLVLINKNKGEMYTEAKDICDDEIFGVIGTKSGNFIFVDELIFPDIPLSKGVKKFDDEVYCAFISDLHVGSKQFLGESFDRFLNWLNGKGGNEEQKRIVSKLKYLFIGGDLVDGVGIYPGQEEDLDIKDIYKQYDTFTELIKKVPDNIKIIICPGNHDALRLTEPQPAIDERYCEELINKENVFMVSNPSLVNIHSSEDFNGFDVLLYHGTSFNYYLDNVESIRTNGGYTRADLVMEYLLKKRHLAPTHISTSYIPNPDADHLVIDKVPDFFLTGHIHRLSVSSYRGISLLNASCWIGQTDFQEKVGLIPQPGKVVVANLATRDLKILSFYDES